MDTTYYYLNNWERLEIYYDNFIDDIRNYDCIRENVKLDFRENRSYDFPKDLNFDWDWYDSWEDDEEKNWEKIFNDLQENYYRYFVDCYIHSNYNFSLAWQWIQCRWDTAKKCGIVAIEKKKFEELWIQEDPHKFLDNFIKKYDIRFNWWILGLNVQTKETYIHETNGSKIEQRENQDWNTWYFDIQEILDEYKEFDPLEWWEYDSYEDLKK